MLLSCLVIVVYVSSPRQDATADWLRRGNTFVEFRHIQRSAFHALDLFVCGMGMAENNKLKENVFFAYLGLT